MASAFPAERDGRGELHTRKGHDMTWSCDIHGEPIKFYCNEHKIPICHPCATKDHRGQKPCELDDIGNVILERRRKLDGKQHEIEKTQKQLKTLDSKIESIATISSNHFQTVNDALKVTSKDKSKSVKDKAGDTIRSINEEADEEIRIINKRREKRIKSCNEGAEQQQLIIKKSYEKILSETNEMYEAVSKKIKKLASKNQHAISTMGNIDTEIKRIKQDDKTLVHEALQVLASLDDNLSLNVHQDVSDCLDRIQREVQKVKFVKGKVGGEDLGRIDGSISKWELAIVKSVRIPTYFHEILVRGLISDDEICVWDVWNMATYVTNISTGHTHEVIEGGREMSITSCAPIDSNVIVCGKRRRGCTGKRLDGCITLYDRQWKVIMGISIPRKNRSDDNSVYVDVDRNGMILAAEYGQSNIYVINPADGKIVLVNTITMHRKLVFGEIQALSSGDIVMNTDDNEFTVISRSGEEKAVIHCDEWFASQCCVDKLTDTLYITYSKRLSAYSTWSWDRTRTGSAVDQLSCDGIIQARRILEYKTSHKGSSSNPCLVTSSGNLVACTGDRFYVYKKRLMV